MELIIQSLRSPRRLLPTAAVAAAALAWACLLFACSTGDRQEPANASDAAAMTPAASAIPPQDTAESADSDRVGADESALPSDDTESPVTTTAAEVAIEDRDQVLRLAAPTLSGELLDISPLAGRDVLLWFWSPL